jgi:hypothetical protein
MILRAAICCATAFAACSAPAPAWSPPASKPATPPASAPPADAPAKDAPTQDAPTPDRPRLPAARFPSAEALLDAAERVSATLTTFTSGVTLETTDDVTNDTERRNGQVVFVQDAGKPETRRFAVVFATYVDSGGRVDQRPVRYLYGDGWLTEADFTQRTLIRRQLARPGEPYDPLKPGEGPVPLPVGQRKIDVLKGFEVALVETPSAPSLAKLRDVQGIAMTPRPGMADRELVKATVWYDLRSKAPVGIEAQRRNGRTVVLLRNPELNKQLSDEQRSLLALAAGQTEGWRVDERPLPTSPATSSPASPPTSPPASPPTSTP